MNKHKTPILPPLAEPEVVVKRIEITRDGTRLGFIDCPFGCRTKNRPPRVMEHQHGFGHVGEDIRPYAGGRASHCMGTDKPGYVLVLTDELVREFGSLEERRALEGVSA